MPSFIPQCIDEQIDPSTLSSGHPEILAQGIPPYVPRMIEECGTQSVAAIPAPPPNYVDAVIVEPEAQAYNAAPAVLEAPMATAMQPTVTPQPVMQPPVMQQPVMQQPVMQPPVMQVPANPAPQGIPCASCGNLNHPGVRFCQFCGTPQQAAVPQAPPAMNFCAFCGTRKLASAPACPNCGTPC